MKHLRAMRWVVAPIFCLGVDVSHALAADDPTLEGLATCKDSWLAWKDDPARGKKFAELLSGYTGQGEGYLVPKAKETVFGLPVARVYPQSVGMGVGFSVTVNGSFDVARPVVEKAIGKKMKCEPANDEIRGCESELGPQRTVMVASNPGDDKTTMIGCYYFYEK